MRYDSDKLINDYESAVAQANATETRYQETRTAYQEAKARQADALHSQSEDALIRATAHVQTTKHLMERCYQQRQQAINRRDAYARALYDAGIMPSSAETDKEEEETPHNIRLFLPSPFRRGLGRRPRWS